MIRHRLLPRLRWYASNTPSNAVVAQYLGEIQALLGRPEAEGSLLKRSARERYEAQRQQMRTLALNDLAAAHPDIVEILAAALSGGAIGNEVQALYRRDGTPQGVCHFFTVINPEHTIGREAFLDRMDTMCAMMSAVAPMPSHPW